MKTTTLLIAEYIKPAIDVLIYVFKAFFKAMSAFGKAFIDARQKQTNYNIAMQLWKTEFRKESFDTVLAAVNRGDLDALKQN